MGQLNPNDHTYTPSPLTRRPARETPRNQTRIPASKGDTGRGRYSGIGTSGGGLTDKTGRRPVHDCSKGID